MKNRLKIALAFALILSLTGTVGALAQETSAGSSEEVQFFSIPETAGDIPVVITEDTNEEGALIITIPEGAFDSASSAEDAAAPVEEKKMGFPQLDVSSYSSQVFWLVVSFAVLYLLMSKLALPRVTEVLDMRQTQKNGNLDRAQAMQSEAEKIRAAYETALAQAQSRAQDTLKEAEQSVSEKSSAESGRFAEESRKRVAAAEQAITKAKTEALASLEDISADIAVDIVAKVADIQISKADAKKAVAAELKKAA